MKRFPRAERIRYEPTNYRKTAIMRQAWQRPERFPKSPGGGIFQAVFVQCLLVALYCAVSIAAPPERMFDQYETHADFDALPRSMDDAPLSPWFILPTVVNVYPKLESERLIRQYYNPAMKLIAPGFRNVRTITGLRDEHFLWTPSLSVGRVVSPHLALYVQFGYGAGKVRTKRQDTSILLIPLHTDFEIYRSAAYFGVCADIFPWGMPERKQYDGIRERLLNTKPSIGLRLTETYAAYEVKVKNSLTRHGRFLTLKMRDSWWVTSFNANVGADIPLGRNSALSVNAGYNFSFSRSFDFDGAAFTIGWKHYFR